MAALLGSSETFVPRHIHVDRDAPDSGKCGREYIPASFIFHEIQKIILSVYPKLQLNLPPDAQKIGLRYSP